MYLDGPVDASEWIYPESDDDGQNVDAVFESMRLMGVLSAAVPSDKKAAAAHLELHPQFRQQLRQALAVRDTSPWKEQARMSISAKRTFRALIIREIENRRYLTDKGEFVETMFFSGSIFGVM